MFIITEKEFINADHIRSIKVSETKPRIIEAVADLGNRETVIYSYDYTHDIAVSRINQLERYYNLPFVSETEKKDVEDIRKGNITQADKNVIPDIKNFVYGRIYELVEDLEREKRKGTLIYDMIRFN